LVLPVPSTDGRFACDFTLYLHPTSQASPPSLRFTSFSASLAISEERKTVLKEKKPVSLVKLSF
jgi:hypothetical protein